MGHKLYQVHAETFGSFFKKSLFLGVDTLHLIEKLITKLYSLTLSKGMIIPRGEFHGGSCGEAY